MQILRSRVPAIYESNQIIETGWLSRLLGQILSSNGNGNEGSLANNIVLPNELRLFSRCIDRRYSLNCLFASVVGVSGDHQDRHNSNDELAILAPAISVSYANQHYEETDDRVYPIDNCQDTALPASARSRQIANADAGS